MEMNTETVKRKVANMKPQEPPHEGAVTSVIEQYTAKIPSIGWLGLALGSIAISATIAVVTKRKSTANFVGLWAPSFMLIGIYNKLVKMEQSNKETHARLGEAIH